MRIPDDKLRDANDRAKALQNPYAIRRTINEWNKPLVNNKRGGYYIAEKEAAVKQQRGLSKFFGKARTRNLRLFKIKVPPLFNTPGAAPSTTTGIFIEISFPSLS